MNLTERRREWKMEPFFRHCHNSRMNAFPEIKFIKKRKYSQKTLVEGKSSAVVSVNGIKLGHPRAERSTSRHSTFLKMFSIPIFFLASRERR